MTYVWGVDVSTHAVDLGILNVENSLAQSWDTVTIDRFGGDRSRSFAKLYDALPLFFAEWAERLPPTVVVVEDPYVAMGDQSWLIGVLAYTLGAVRLATDAPTHSVASATWKATCGYGGAKKPQIMGWARAIGYTGHRQDHADALGVAQHAASLYRLAVQHGDV